MLAAPSPEALIYIITLFPVRTFVAETLTVEFNLKTEMLNATVKSV